MKKKKKVLRKIRATEVFYSLYGYINTDLLLEEINQVLADIDYRLADDHLTSLSSNGIREIIIDNIYTIIQEFENDSYDIVEGINECFKDNGISCKIKILK